MFWICLIDKLIYNVQRTIIRSYIIMFSSSCLQGRLLSRLLTHTHLPGLSSLDQMHLLALADTVSTCNTDFSERFAIDAAKSAIAKENLTGVPEGEATSG